MRRVAVLVFALAVTAVAGARQGPQAPQPPPRTGIIIGQVVDAGTGAPIPEAIVALASSSRSATDTSAQLRLMADADGRFVFMGLPPGVVTMTATRLGYLPSAYGRRRPDGAGSELELQPGEARDDVTIPMWKPAAITGAVTDEAGEPVVGVSVNVLKRTMTAGQPTFTLARFGSNVRTDDRGVFRSPELLPADYVVAVPATQTTIPAALLQQVQVAGAGGGAMQSEMSTATSGELTFLGNARNQQIGDFVLMTRSSATIPPAPAGNGLPAVYRTTFSPSAASPTEAAVVTVRSGEERSGVNIQIRPARAVRVSGMLVPPPGAPAVPRAVRLLAANEPDIMSYFGFEVAAGMSDAKGAFTLLGIPPGQYTIKVASPPLGRGPVSSPDPTRPLVWANQLVTVAEADLADVAVTLQTAPVLSGRVEFKGSKPPPAAAVVNKALITLESGAHGVYTLDSWIRVDPAGSFAAAAPAGRYFLRPDPLPDGWWARSVTYQGRDVLDAPLDLRADAAGIVVTYADDTQRVSGTVRDQRGAPDPNAAVLLCPSDRSVWTSAQPPRRTRTARVTRTGGFVLSDMAPGDYFVVAFDDALLDQVTDPKFLDVLSRVATSVSVREFEKKTVDLKMSTVR
jgi:hypothetical protein